MASVYFPTGEADTDRQLEKERFMAAVAARMAVLLDATATPCVCGDWNIAHTENDIKNWRGNVKKAGLSAAASGSGSPICWPPAGWTWCGVLHPDVAGPYTWWSWRGKAFDNDAGWRIDYQLATPGLAARVASVRSRTSGRPTRCGGPTTARSPSTTRDLR